MLRRYQLPFRVLLLSALGIFLLNFLSRSIAHSKSSQVTFSLGPAGLALESGDTLLVAARLNNTSDDPAYRVQIESISLTSAPLISPTTFPVSVGKIDASQNAVVQASFNSSQLTQGPQYLLQVQGSYRPVDKGTKEDKGHEFTVTTGIVLPPAAPGSANVQTNNAPSNTVSGGGFPPVQFPVDFDEANETGPPVPTGPFVGGTPTQTGTGAQPAVLNDPPVTFDANDSEGLRSGRANGEAGTIAEPSGAANSGGIVFSTANHVAAYSTNGGTSFTSLNPTTIFPKDVVGSGCDCDQIVQYVPGIDRFIWLIQANGYLIASASPAQVKSSGAKAWKYWKLTAKFFGLGITGLDYPHLAVGNNYLYLSADAAGTPVNGLLVARIPLSQIQAGSSITVDYTHPKNGHQAWGSAVTQNTFDEAFWAGHDHTSKLRVFSWAEGSGTYYWRDVKISSWSNTGLSSITPDHIDWMTKLSGFPGNHVIGATRGNGSQSNQLWFAWSAGTDSNFPQPHVEIVTLDRSDNFSVIQQVQIWDSGYAYAYPALATNACTGEIGFSLEGGGDGNYENHLVGFWGDFLAYITTNSDVGTARYGDYVTIRQHPGLFGAFFDAFGYGLNTVTVRGVSKTQTDVHYVLFGRGGACSQGS